MEKSNYINELIRESEPLIRKYALKMTFHNKELAEDIIQDFYEVVFKDPSKYLEGLKTKRFIYIGLRNALSNYLSKYKDQGVHVERDQSEFFVSSVSGPSTIEGRLDEQIIRAFFLPPSKEKQLVDQVQALARKGLSITRIMKALSLTSKQVERYKAGIMRKQDSNTKVYTEMLFSGYDSYDIIEETGHKKETVLSTLTYLRRKMRNQFESFDQVKL